MNVDPGNKVVAHVMHRVRRFDPVKHRRRRQVVVDKNNKAPKIIKSYFLCCIKRSDAFDDASPGTDLDQGPVFSSMPRFPHGLNGIVAHHDARIGHGCTITRRVAIGARGERCR